jgi:hypothetical protein
MSPTVVAEVRSRPRSRYGWWRRTSSERVPYGPAPLKAAAEAAAELEEDPAMSMWPSGRQVRSAAAAAAAGEGGARTHGKKRQERFGSRVADYDAAGEFQ